MSDYERPSHRRPKPEKAAFTPWDGTDLTGYNRDIPGAIKRAFSEIEKAQQLGRQEFIEVSTRKGPMTEAIKNLCNSMSMKHESDQLPHKWATKNAFTGFQDKVRIFIVDSARQALEARQKNSLCYQMFGHLVPVDEAEEDAVREVREEADRLADLAELRFAFAQTEQEAHATLKVIAKNAIEIDHNSGILSDDGSEKSVSALEQDFSHGTQKCQEIVATLSLGNAPLSDEQKILLNPVRIWIFKELGVFKSSHTPLNKKPKKATLGWILEQPQKCSDSDFVDSAINNSKASSVKSLGESFVIINPESSVSQKPKLAAPVVRLEGGARLELGDRRLVQHGDGYVVVDRDGNTFHLPAGARVDV